MIPEAAADWVDVLGVRFPRLTAAAVLQLLLTRLGGTVSTGVCFPDMSTLNLAAERPEFLRRLQTRMLVFNDGAGLGWAARRQGRPLPANLNGTDLVPQLLHAAPLGTTVFLLGAQPGVAERAQAILAARFDHLQFVGSHHGYLDATSEAAVVEKLRTLRPQIVLVAMGNPRQVEFIDRHLDDAALGGTLFLAVGGQLDYYGGTLRRAPAWWRRLRLEWLYIVLQQPYKARRYFVGIPQFMLRCLAAERRGTHVAVGDRDQGMKLPLGATVRDTLRATVKGVLRHAAMGIGQVLVRQALTAPRVLTYHGVCSEPPDEWSVTPAQLRRHARWLAECCRPVPLLDIVRWRRGELMLPPRAVAVTFDDGLRDVLIEAVPILADFGIPATAFIAPGLIAGQPAHPSYRATRPFLSWMEVREVGRAGWTIGSHALTHPVLAELSEAAVSFELGESRRILADVAEVPVTMLAYPYGTRSTVSPREYGLARAAGYEAAFLDMTAPLLASCDPFALPRNKVLRTDSLAVVRASVEGRMDFWRLIEAR